MVLETPWQPLLANGSDFAPVDPAAGYIRGEKYSNYGMERFCNKRVFRDFFICRATGAIRYRLEAYATQGRGIRRHGRPGKKASRRAAADARERIPTNALDQFIVTRTSFFVLQHNKLWLREAADAEPGCGALHCTELLRRRQQLCRAFRHRMGRNRKDGSAYDATMGFFDPGPGNSQNSHQPNLRSAGRSSELCKICWNYHKAQSVWNIAQGAKLLRVAFLLVLTLLTPYDPPNDSGFIGSAMLVDRR